MDGIYARTVTLKVKYGNMKQITRSKSGDAICRAKDIYDIAASLLDTVEKSPIRLVGISLSGFTASNTRQVTLEDLYNTQGRERSDALEKALLNLERRFGGGVIKTGGELIAEKRFKNDEEGEA